VQARIQSERYQAYPEVLDIDEKRHTQPMLHTMYVDKRLADVQAVQTCRV
jgi:hypothetical protein